MLPVTDLQALPDGCVVVLDGAMSTELTHRGVDTANALWGSLALDSAPEAIRAVHASYFDAGARVATTNTYQANVPAFEAAGYSAAEASGLIARGAGLAREASEAFERGHAGVRTAVAGSIGPYGAYLADGSEYTGDYELDAAAFAGFHRPRIAALAGSVDVFAVETQPKLAEARAIVALLAEEFPATTAWVSFQLRDPETLADGTPLADAARWADGQANVLAVGTNCVAPALVTPALRLLGRHTGKPLLAYPNSGDVYDPASKTWRDADRRDRFTRHVPEWLDLGVRMVGGCCRTTPDDIAIVAAEVGDAGGRPDA